MRAGLLRPQARREPGAGLRAGLLRQPLGAPSERELEAGLRAGLLRRKTPGLGLVISSISR